MWQQRSALHGEQEKMTAMNTSRRTLLAGLAGMVAAPNAASAAGAMSGAGESTVAEESFARMIAAAQAPGAGCAWQAERYADLHWRDYIAAARAVLNARA
jgi:hypothetical protein